MSYLNIFDNFQSLKDTVSQLAEQIKESVG